MPITRLSDNEGYDKNLQIWETVNTGNTKDFEVCYKIELEGMEWNKM